MFRVPWRGTRKKAWGRMLPYAAVMHRSGCSALSASKNSGWAAPVSVTPLTHWPARGAGVLGAHRVPRQDRTLAHTLQPGLQPRQASAAVCAAFRGRVPCQVGIPRLRPA